MEKVNTTNTTTDIFVGDKNVGNFTLTTFNNGTMNANFMINDASTFHGSPEAAQDLVNLVNDSISQLELYYKSRHKYVCYNLSRKTEK